MCGVNNLHNGKKVCLCVVVVVVAYIAAGQDPILGSMPVSLSTT